MMRSQRRGLWAMAAMAALCLCGCSASANGNNCGNTVESPGAGGSGGAGGGDAADTGAGGNKPLSYHPVPCGGTVSPYPPPPATPIGWQIDLTVPDKTTLFKIATTITPVGGHVTLPEALPAIEFLTAPVSDPSMPAWAATAHDSAASVDAYEKPHAFTLPLVPSGPGFAVNVSKYTYRIVAISETGVGALGGTMFEGWMCDVAEMP